MSNRSASNPMEPEGNANEPHMELSGLKVSGGPRDDDGKAQSRAVPNTRSGKSTSSSSSSSSGGDGGRKYRSASDEASVPEADVNDDFMNAGIHDQTKSYQSNASSRQHSSVGDKYGRPNRGTKGAVAVSSLSDAHKEDDDGDTQIHATVQAFPTRGSPVHSSTTSLVRDAEDRAESFLRTLARRSEQLSLSSFSTDEPLAQVSIAIFFISILFVVVACSMIIYWCGMGYCIDPRGAENGTTALTTTSQRRANTSKAGHLGV